MRVEKNSFRVLTVASGRIIVESPLRLDVQGREPKECLVLEDGTLSLQGDLCEICVKMRKIKEAFIQHQRTALNLLFKLLGSWALLK